MNSQLKTNVNLTASARAAAHVRGAIRSFEQSQVIFCVSFLILFLASVALKSVMETVWIDIGAGIGLSGLVLVLLCWLFQGKPTQDQNRPASVTIRDGNKFISARDIDPKEVALAFREIIQNRQILPPPNGEVVSEAGMAQARVRAYTEEERKIVGEQIAVDMRKHDEKLLAQLDDLIRQTGTPVASLPEAVESTPTPSATEAERTLIKAANSHQSND